MKKWVIPDIHGCARTLKALIEEKVQPSKEDQLIFLGDYIDRGPDSKGVIDYLLQLEEKGHKLTCLKGNHEEFMIRAIEEEKKQKKFLFWKSKNYILEEWLVYGGKEALDSFGTTDINSIEPKYVEWLQKLKYYSIEDNYLLVHAGINCHKEDPFEDTHSMLWTKEFDIIPEKINHLIVLHGHVPLSLEFIRSSIEERKYPFICLDNGCVYTDRVGMGNLIALELTTKELHVQHNIEYLK